VSAEDGFKNEKILAITLEVMIIFPLLCFILFLIAKSSRLLTTLKNIYQKCKSCIGRRNEEQDDFPSPINSPSVHQVLIEHIALGDNNYYGAVDNSTY
jgi:cell division protein FtsL